jgi:hypothetical protein
MEHRITIWVEADASVEEVREALRVANNGGMWSKTSVLDNVLGDVLGVTCDVLDTDNEEAQEDE